MTNPDDVLAEGAASALQRKMFSDAGVRESRHVVLALMKSDEIEVAVEWLRGAYAGDTSLVVADHRVYYRIDRDESIRFDLDEIEELIGRRYTVYDFLVNVSTTIGRAYVHENTFVLTTELIGWESEVPR
jgi:hypothetical protein